MNQVFISYSREDNEWTDAFVASLSSLGIEAWIDRRSIPVILSWLDEIADAIEEGALFVVCDSPAWRASLSCQTEHSIAAGFDKPVVGTTVGSDPSREAQKVAEAYRALPAAAFVRNELRVRVRGWERSGRSKAMLVGPRVRRRLERTLKDDHGTATEQAYIHSSRRRSLRRGVTVAFVATLVALTAISSDAFGQAGSQLAQTNASIATQYQDTNAIQQDIFADPYAGLSAAAQRAPNDVGVYSEALSDALADPIPDRSLNVPAGAIRFSSTPIGPELSVLTGSGATWTHSLGSSSPDPPGYASVMHQVAAQDWSASVFPDSGLITVTEQGRVYRNVAVGDHPSALVFSPDARWLAVALGTEVDIIDVQRGEVRQTLRGAPSPISEIAWSRSADRLWAISGGRVISWSTGQGRVLEDQPSAWYQAVFPSNVAQDAWLIDRQGNVVEINATSGIPVQRLTDSETVYSAAINLRHSQIFIVGSNGASFVGLQTGKILRVKLSSSCQAGRGSYSLNGEDLFIPCSGSDLLEINAASGSLVRQIDVPGGAQSVTVDPVTGDIVVGGWTGKVYELNQLWTPTLLYADTCQPFLTSVAVAPQGNAILAVGEPTGLVDCTDIGNESADGSFTWNAIIDSAPESIGSDVATFDPSGNAFVIGYDDGSVDFHPTNDIIPEVTNDTVVGEIRGLAFIGNRLLVATSSGMVQSLQVCGACLTNHYLAQEATAQLRKADALGLTSIKPLAQPGR